MADNSNGKRRVGGTRATDMKEGYLVELYDKLGGMYISMILSPKIRVQYLKIILPTIHDTHLFTSYT